MATFAYTGNSVPIVWNAVAVPWSSGKRPCPPPAQATATPRIADWCVVAKSWLLSQFRDSARLIAAICAFASAFDDIEQAIADMEQLRSIDTAFGAQLDVLGLLVGLERESWEEDEDYRLALIAWALATITDGFADDAIRVAQAYLNGRSTVTYLEDYPMTVRLTVDDQVLNYDQGHRLAVIVRQTVPVSVDFALLYRPVGLPIITFDDDTIHPLVPLNEPGATFGGVLAEADPGGHAR